MKKIRRPVCAFLTFKESDDRDLALKTLDEKPQNISASSPLFMNNYFDVKKPTFASDIIWENKLQSKKWFYVKLVSLTIIFFLGFSFVAMGIYKMKQNQ